VKVPSDEISSEVADLRSGSTSEVGSRNREVRFTPENRLNSDIAACPFGANCRLMHRSKRHRYSITLSARSRSDSGIARPSVFAVLRLMMSSYLDACSTGRSAGLTPLRILSM